MTAFVNKQLKIQREIEQKMKDKGCLNKKLCQIMKWQENKLANHDHDDDEESKDETAHAD